MNARCNGRRNVVVVQRSRCCRNTGRKCSFLLGGALKVTVVCFTLTARCRLFSVTVVLLLKSPPLFPAKSCDRAAICQDRFSRLQRKGQKRIKVLRSRIKESRWMLDSSSIINMVFVARTPLLEAFPSHFLHQRQSNLWPRAREPMLFSRMRITHLNN